MRVTSLTRPRVAGERRATTRNDFKPSLAQPANLLPAGAEIGVRIRRGGQIGGDRQPVAAIGGIRIDFIELRDRGKRRDRYPPRAVWRVPAG